MSRRHSARLYMIALGVFPGLLQAQTQLPNPSAVFCVENGGIYTVRTVEGGETGLCTLADGQEVDAWKFFRANAKAD